MSSSPLWIFPFPRGNTIVVTPSSPSFLEGKQTHVKWRRKEEEGRRVNCDHATESRKRREGKRYTDTLFTSLFHSTSVISNQSIISHHFVASTGESIADFSLLHAGISLWKLIQYHSALHFGSPFSLNIFDASMSPLPSVPSSLYLSCPRLFDSPPLPLLSLHLYCPLWPPLHTCRARSIEAVSPPPPSLPLPFQSRMGRPAREGMRTPSREWETREIEESLGGGRKPPSHPY